MALHHFDGPTASRSGPMVRGWVHELVNGGVLQVDALFEGAAQIAVGEDAADGAVGPMMTTMPRPPRDIGRMPSEQYSGGPTGGNRVAARMTSRTWVTGGRGAPGCERAKSSGPKPRASRSATAGASPGPSAAVVAGCGGQVVGAGFLGDSRIQVDVGLPRQDDGGLPVMATSLAPGALTSGTIRTSSSDSPEFESASRCRRGAIMPRSPWLASAG